MSSINSTAPVSAPTIRISASDYDVIAELALRMQANQPELSRLILGEIERADIVDGEDLPANVVAIGSRVTFADDSNGTQRTVDLVLPGHADIARDRISVLSPVGAGLVGMQAGGRIDWPCPDGRARSLTIMRVEKGSVDG